MSGTDLRHPVWAGLSGPAAPEEAARLAAMAEAGGGVVVEAEGLAAFAAFADAPAAAAWLARALEPGGDLSGALRPGEAAEEVEAAEAALRRLLADADPGEAIVAPGMPPPEALLGWSAGRSEADPEPAEAAPTRLSAAPAAPTRLTAPRGTGTAPASIAPPPPAGTTDLSPGAVLSHTYRIEKLIGRGGMGSVFLARHVDLGSLHAIKVISPEHARDEHVVGLFRREAESLRSVRHDAVIAHEGAIRDEHGRLYLVMEYADGPTLADVLRDGPLPSGEVEALARRVGEGLEAAHEKGIVHRDLSPDNIVLVGNDVARAQIIDFGIARNLGAASRTLIGSQFAGKYSYASPEQLGLFGGQVDRRSDMYSLGLVIAAALGRPIGFGRSPIEAARGREHLPDLSGFEEPWKTRLGALLEPDPRDRPERYSALVESPGTHARQTRPDAPRPRRSGLRRAGLLLLVLSAAGVALWTMRDRLAGLIPEPEAPDRVATAPADPVDPPGTPEPRVGSGAGTAPGTGVSVPPAGDPAPPRGTEGLGTPAGPGQTPQQPPESLLEDPPDELTGDTSAPPAGEGASVVRAPPPLSAVREELVAAIAAAMPAGGCQRIEPLLQFEPDGHLVTLTGVAGSEAMVAAARRAAEAHPHTGPVHAEVAVHPSPFCEFLALIGPGDRRDAPAIGLNNGDGIYREGERIIFSVTARGEAEAHVYLVYVDPAGTAIHLLPNPLVPDHRLAPGETVTLGDPTVEGPYNEYTAMPPHGRNLLVAVASSTPLFDVARPQQEAALEDFLPALGAALERLRATGGRVAFATRFVETRS